MNANIISGVLLIILGLLAKKFPILIAGYNTMPKRKKQKVDVKGLCTFIMRAFTAMGFLIIVLHFIFTWVGLSRWVELLSPVIIPVGAILTVIMAQKYDHNKT